jgi:hypothetical protein
MRRTSWIGWLLAGLLLLQNAATGLAAAGGDNPLQGRLLRHSTGTLYLYHSGHKFAVQMADVGDQVIEAIPSGSPSQFETMFGDSPALAPLRPGVSPPWPWGYS